MWAELGDDQLLLGVLARVERAGSVYIVVFESQL